MMKVAVVGSSLLLGCGASVVVDGGADRELADGGSGGEVGGGGEGGRDDPAPRRLVAGNKHTCQLQPWEEVGCWGGNSLGELGDGTTETQLQPAVAALTPRVAQVSSGALHTCARALDNTLWCWGKNDLGHLGVGTTTRSESIPQQVLALGANVVDVAAGGQHTCAVTQDGKLWCWGWNSHGQLGDGTNDDRSTPVQVASLGSSVVDVAVSFVHTCARTDDGAVWCWGYNQEGQLGVGSAVESNVPVEVSALGTEVLEIELGGWHSCARKTDGSLWCWGFNGQGGIGDGTTTFRALPVEILGSDAAVSQVAIDASNTCARTENGALWCWGDNMRGDVGDGTTVDRHRPVEITSLGTDVVDVALGYWHGCARKADDTVWCWGDNAEGQLGDGTTVGHPVPTPVFGTD